MAITRQGVTLAHEDDLLEEQGLRIRSFDFALKSLGSDASVDTLVEESEKIFEFLSKKTVTKDESITSESGGSSSDSKSPKSGLVHFAS